MVGTMKEVCLGLINAALSPSGKIEADFLGDDMLWTTPTFQIKPKYFQNVATEF